jgi:hypothetical protein
LINRPLFKPNTSIYRVNKPKVGDIGVFKKVIHSQILFYNSSYLKD